jgi:NAD(P)-dependent dehydrogenase (short-subunit alcohol dehydrogenase family)
VSKPLEPIRADLTGKTAVVTGATSGIGREAAFGLAKLGASVTVVGRSAEKCAATVDELVRRGAARERLAVATADLARLPAVRALADELAARHERIDVLLNNAGCYPARRTITADGFEEAWATNTLAYEVLTTRLHERVAAAKGRIVYVGSTQAGGLDLEDLDWSRRWWTGVRSYRQTKQANRMLAWAWDRRLAGTGATINVAHPGGVNTGIAGRQTGVYGLISRLAFKTQRTPEMGGDVLLWLASSPEVAGSSGGFYKDRRALVCQWKGDVDTQERLWSLCQRQIS